MFTYQENTFWSQATECSLEAFWEAIRKPATQWKINSRREIMLAVENHDEAAIEHWLKNEEYQKFLIKKRNMKRVREREAFMAKSNEEKLLVFASDLKASLPAFIFACREFDAAQTAKGTPFRHRRLKYCHLNGLVMLDIDHVDNPLAIWERLNQNEELMARTMLVHVTSSERGIRVIFTADTQKGNLADNQIDFAQALGYQADRSCIDATRTSFAPKEEDILFINDNIFTYYNEEFDKTFTADYRNGETQPLNHEFDNNDVNADGVGASDTDKVVVSSAEEHSQMASEKISWLGYDIQQFIDRMFDKALPCKEKSNRHESSLKLASDLLVLLDGDKKTVEELLRRQSWVKEIIDERNENVEQTVESAIKRKTKSEGERPYQYPSKKMQEAIKAVTGRTFTQIKQVADSTDTATVLATADPDDVYAAIPLNKFADELTKLSKHYPCMKELFVNVHPQKMPAVLFSAAAMFGTLMTRAWYHFWYDPELMRRLNYSIFIIGDPGAGKNVVEKFYKKIAEPMIMADKEMIDSVNRYKEGRTERTTSTKAQKGDALKKPQVGIRVHPARTANGEFIRHMLAAVENVQGRELCLHMFSFDSELDNVTKNSKGGDYKDKEVLELKAFHNEEDGQMYANTESVTGMFNVYWNFIYTGTPYALHRKVNQRNFGTGLSTRLAVIPLPDVGLAKRRQQVDPQANETLRTWAYRLDKVEGELPIEPLNDETYTWQSQRMEVAEFNGDKADRTLLKRIPYYGIGISLPFIVMRHWDEWQEHRTLTIDAKDRQLCRLAMEIQYRCQQFFFGEMAHNYFEDQNKAFVTRRRTTRYDDCYSKLPDEFKTQQFMDCFGVSQPTASRAIGRMIHDGIVERVNRMQYRKLLQQLP